MEIPLNAQIECTDGVCGRSEFVLINPIRGQVTHLVVKEDLLPNSEYIVPVDLIIETVAETIRLSCTKEKLERLDPFLQTAFIAESVPDMRTGFGGMIGIGTAFNYPYVTPEMTIYEPVDTQEIPPGELAVRRGTSVEATDGFVGKVDEFVVNPINERITHLVMREGHLWGKKDVIIPLSAISAEGETDKDTVRLKLNKLQVGALPTFPIHRLWD